MALLSGGDSAVAAFAKGLSDFDLVEALGDPEVLESWAFAAKIRMIATLYARPVMYPPQPSPDDPRGDGASPSSGQARPGRARKRRKRLSREDLTVAEVAARLAITPHRAALLLSMARALTGRLSRTLTGVWDRKVNAYKAQLIVELVMPMADHEYDHQIAEGASPLHAERAARAKARQVEDRILDEAAAGQTPSAFRQRIRRAVASVRPRYADLMCKRAIRARKVTLRTDLPDGIAILSAELSAADALQIWENLHHEAHTQQEAGDERTLDQLRADILVYLLTHPSERRGNCTCADKGTKPDPRTATEANTDSETGRSTSTHRSTSTQSGPDAGAGSGSPRPAADAGNATTRRSDACANDTDAV
jgi:hypothetical protein